jgi:SAM-dependent methyltransferase
MCDEMSKATERRKVNPVFAEKYFVGLGIDVGCGYDKMNIDAFPLCTAIVGHDQCLGDKNAEHLAEVLDNHYDFLVSSHCLEHMISPETALGNWIRVVKPGGHLVITVPDWEMYEHKKWPSRFNGDHRTAWTMSLDKYMPSHLRILPEWLAQFNVDILRCETIKDGFDKSLPDEIDQTAREINKQPFKAECCIEIILRKI